MNTHTSRLIAPRSLAILRAVPVVAALTAYATGAAAQGVGKPTGTIELGPGDVTQGSYKAGEYNGLQKEGAFLTGSLDLRNSIRFDSDSAMRWRIRGSDIGLDTRSLSAVGGVQGRFRLSLAFDQLRRNRSDSYQTPLEGAGSGTLRLPSAWLVPNVTGSTAPNARGLAPSVGGAPFISSGAITQPGAAQLALVNGIAATDVPLFNNYDLFTRRTRFDGNVTYNMTSAWSVDADFRPEHKSGAKPMGTVSRNVGGDISTIIPDPVDYTHNQVATSLNYKGEKQFLQAGYYGSFFRNGISAVTWQNWASASATVNTLTSPPGNDFNQVNATGGVTLSRSTKLTGNVSYSRGTQNDPFVMIAAAPVVPVTSAGALVVTTSAYAKLTAHPAKKLSVAASYKFDDRNNRTPVHIYQFSDAEEPVVASTSFTATNPLGPVVAQNANANRPYSRKLNLFNTDADFNIAKGQWVKAGYDFEMIDRFCPGSWIDCADAARTKEHTARAEWRMRPTEDVTARVTYAYSARRGPYNEDAWLAIVPYANVVPAGQSLSAFQAMLGTGLTGYGPIAGYNGGVSPDNTFFPNNNAVPPGLYANGGNRISELVGMRRYYVADRDRNRARSLITWQANEQLAFTVGGDLTRDSFPNSRYGMQNNNVYAADADLSYALPDDFSVNVFYTYENLRSASAGNTYTANSNVANVNGATVLSGGGCSTFTTIQQRNNNNKLDPCLDWRADRKDRANTVGVGVRKVAGPLDLTGNLIFTRQRSDNAPTGGNWANNPLVPAGSAASTVAAFYVPATPLPTVTANTSELRLDGRYNVPKGALRLSYAYLRMTNTDWMYEGMQFGTLSGVLPTNEQPFKYSVNVFGISYILRF